MTAINLTISSVSCGKMFRLDTAMADPLSSVDDSSGPEITDELLTDKLPWTVQALYDGTVSYDYALSFFAEMHRRGLIRGTDFHVVVPAVHSVSDATRGQ